jgi:hypothetical protein
MKPTLALEYFGHVALETQELEYDTADEDQAARHLTGQLDILENARAAMISSKVVARDQVKELVDECELGLPDDCPINSYTEEPSSTNLTATLESILESTKNAIVAIAKKLAEILKAAFDAFLNFLNSLLKYSKNYQKVKANLARLCAARDAVHHELMQASGGHSSVSLSPEEQALDQTIGAKIADIEQRWNDNWNGMLADVLAEGPYTIGLRAIAINCVHGFDLIQGKLNLFAALVKDKTKNLNNQVTLQTLVEQFDSIATPIAIEPYAAAIRVFDKSYVYNDKPDAEDSLSTVAGYVRQFSGNLYRSKPTTVVSIEDAAAQLGVSNGQHTQHLLRVPDAHGSEVFVPIEELHNKVVACRAEVQVLLGETGPMDRNGYLQGPLRMASTVLTYEVRGMIKLLVDAAQLNTTLLNAAIQCSQYRQAQLNQMMLHLRAGARVDPTTFGPAVTAAEAEIDRLKKDIEPIGL